MVIACTKGKYTSNPHKQNLVDDIESSTVHIYVHGLMDWMISTKETMQLTALHHNRTLLTRNKPASLQKVIYVQSQTEKDEQTKMVQGDYEQVSDDTQERLESIKATRHWTQETIVSPKYFHREHEAHVRLTVNVLSYLCDDDNPAIWEVSNTLTRLSF